MDVNIEVDILNTEPFAEMLDVLDEMQGDENVPEKYRKRIDKLFEQIKDE